MGSARADNSRHTKIGTGDAGVFSTRATTKDIINPWTAARHHSHAAKKTSTKSSARIKGINGQSHRAGGQCMINMGFQSKLTDTCNGRTCGLAQFRKLPESNRRQTAAKLHRSGIANLSSRRRGDTVHRQGFAADADTVDWWTLLCKQRRAGLNLATWRRRESKTAHIFDSATGFTRAVLREEGTDR